jgi:DNA-binding SARP family transcriptional activator
VPRGRLVELLWPAEDDPDVLANRLSVALATVRRVLDPDRAHPANHYVRTEDGSVTLALHRLEVDVETFLHEAAAGLRARSTAGTGAGDAVTRLRRAAAAYRGEVLEEDVYADWAHALREEARAAYLAVLRALAADAAAAGDTDQAVVLLIRLLDHDHYDEPAHLAMVSALAAAGRYGDARRAHRGYAARMAEIGVQPAPMPAGRRAPTGGGRAGGWTGGGGPSEPPPPAARPTR